MRIEPDKGTDEFTEHCRTPPGEWHWHGAAPDHFMAHLAFTEGQTEWGEHLTAGEYPSEQ